MQSIVSGAPTSPSLSFNCCTHPYSTIFLPSQAEKQALVAQVPVRLPKFACVSHPVEDHTKFACANLRICINVFLTVVSLLILQKRRAQGDFSLDRPC